MRACFEDGYRPFPAFPGYTKVKLPNHKHRVDVLNDKSPIVKEALEGFADMTFVTKADVVRFLQQKGVFSAKQSHEKLIETVTRLLSNPFPGGFVEYKPWDVPFNKGAYEAIISWETYTVNQKRLEGRTFVFVRKTIREELELRGLVLCADCGKAMTGAITTNKKRGRKHLYYKCQNKKGKCVSAGKSVRAEIVHKNFFHILEEMTAKDEVANLAMAIFDDVWKNEMSLKQKENSALLSKKNDIEETISKLAERITKTTNETLIKEYEKQIEKLSKELEDICHVENLEYDLAVPNRTAQEEVKQVLKSPYAVWQNYPVVQKRRFFTFLFEDNLVYNRNLGYRTPKFLYL